MPELSSFASGGKFCYHCSMSKVEKISVALTHDMAGLVKSAVKSGEYGSASEAIREALRDWANKREREKLELEYLRGAWKQGIKSGAGKFTSIEDLLAEAHSRHDK